MSDAKKVVDAAAPAVQKVAEVAPSVLDSGMDAAAEIVNVAANHKRGLLIAGVAAIAVAGIAGTAGYMFMKRRKTTTIEIVEAEPAIVEDKKSPVVEKK